jgi:DNA mismatch endonuclease (patch repair protein)
MPARSLRRTSSVASQRPRTPADAQALKRFTTQRRRDTQPELAIRRLVHAKGLRYLVDAPLPLKGVRRRADLSFTRARIAVFIDGCYWHSCPIHATQPKANAEWWAAKLAANQLRDRDTDGRLEDAGWIVLRIWEHELPADAADKVELAVRTRLTVVGRDRYR